MTKREHHMRLGFLGGGFIARQHAIRMLADGEEEVTFSRVFDPDTAHAAAFAAETGAVVAASPDEVLEDCDAVFVCSWTSAHLELVEAAARRGVPLYCEKPLDFDARGAAAMADLVRSSGVVNQVGLLLRFSPALHVVQELLADRTSGRLMTVVFRDDQYIPIQGTYDSTWRADPERAGRGTLLEHSIHDLDVIDWLFGPVEAVAAQTADFHNLGPIEDLAVCQFRFPGGALGTLTSVWHDLLERPSLRRIEVFCERLYVAVEGEWLGPVRYHVAGSDEVVLEGDDLVGWLEARGARPEYPYDAFVRRARSGQHCLPDFDTAVRAHELADAAYTSAAARGAWIAVCP